MTHEKHRLSTARSPINGKPALAPIDSLAIGYDGLRLPAAVLLDDVRSMYNVGAFFSRGGWCVPREAMSLRDYRPSTEKSHFEDRPGRRGSRSLGT